MIHRPAKLGLGTAHVEGILWAYEHGYSQLVTMDCDFTHPPEAIPRFVELAPECHVVVGSRFFAAGQSPGVDLAEADVDEDGACGDAVVFGDAVGCDGVVPVVPVGFVATSVKKIGTFPP